MDSSLRDIQGLRVAVEGCVCLEKSQSLPMLTQTQGHGTLNAIYAATEKACQERGWQNVDLLIIGGDFQVNIQPQSICNRPNKPRQFEMFLT